MRSKARTLSLSVVLLLIGVATAHAACPTTPFYIDLKSGLFGTLFGPNPNITYSGFIPSPAVGCTGWKEAVLKINLKDCTKATIWAQWEGLPTAWTLNIGDSPTNDGFGGDAGTTTKDAEMWINGETMGVAANDVSPGVIYTQDLSLFDGALEFVVKNQFLSWGQPYAFLQTPVSNQLFALAALDPSDSTVGANNIYVGLNRVISGPGTRRGCGLRRVLVTLQ